MVFIFAPGDHKHIYQGGEEPWKEESLTGKIHKRQAPLRIPESNVWVWKIFPIVQVMDLEYLSKV